MTKTPRPRTRENTRAKLLESWTSTPRTNGAALAEEPTNDEFLADLEQVLAGLDAGPDEAVFARGRFVACYFTVSTPRGGRVKAGLSLVPHDGRWTRVRGVQIEITAEDGIKRLTRSNNGPGVAIDKLPVGRIRVALGPCSLPRARRVAPGAAAELGGAIALLTPSPSANEQVYGTGHTVTGPIGIATKGRSQREGAALLLAPSGSGYTTRRPLVTALSLTRMKEVDSRIRFAEPALDRVNVFAPLANEDRRMRTCLTAVLHSPPGQRRLPSFAVEEFCYIHLHGRMDLEFAGAQPVSLSASDDLHVVWVPGYGANEETPPATVVCEDLCAGLIIFFHAGGLCWSEQELRSRFPHRGKRARVPSPVRSVSLGAQTSCEWTLSETQRYWEYLQRVAPALIHERRPVVSRLPLSENRLQETFAADRLPDQEGDAHQRARAAGQIDYARVRGWPSERAERAFKERLGVAQRTVPIFDFRLLLLPGQEASVDARDVCLGRHPNGYEIVIPILGGFRGIGGELPEVEPDLCWIRPRDKGIDPAHLTDLHASAKPEQWVSDYVAVHSDAAFHGFVSAGEGDAYALHARVDHSHAVAGGRAHERAQSQRHEVGGRRRP